MRNAVGHVLCVYLLLLGGEAYGARYALIAANNSGWGSEAPLQFAHKDATRLATILSELGGFEERNLVVLKGATPHTIESALKRLSARMRAAPDPQGQDLLFFYYSGHADEKALHPGSNSLSYERLKQLIQEVPASIRIALLDSCKSGALTKIKGGRPAPSFELKVVPTVQIEGDVFIAAAAVSENALESRRLQGSFFTNYVTSGLRGAADSNDDGNVTLAELYAYAYVMTVGRTTGTRSGAQHPTYRFDLRGKGQLVLTRPGASDACLVFGKGPRKSRYEVLDAHTEAIVSEVPASPLGNTRIGLSPGRYKVRSRTRQGVFEQDIHLLAQECRRVSRDRMKKIILPETLSKGELLQQTRSIYLGYLASLGHITDEGLPIHGAVISLRLPVGRWALRPYLQYGWRRYDGKIQQLDTDLWAAGLAVTWGRPTRWGLVAIGPFAGYSLLYQRFAPVFDRRAVSGLQVGAIARWAVPLPLWRLALATEARAGYSMYGLGDDVSHRLVLDLGIGVLSWW